MRIGIEIGGTFTDLIMVDGNDGVVRAKVPSTPSDLSVGVMNALQDAIGGDLQRVGDVVHGSTVATNALLERKGARLGLLTTAGFRDLLLIQRQEREDIYDLFYRKPESLVPRDRTREVPGRIGVEGEVVEPLDEHAVRVAVAELVEEHSIELLVVSFLFSFVNGAHERLARDLVGEQFPNLSVLLSSEVAPIFREYERTSTTTISAFVKPVVASYLSSVERRLASEGFSGELVIMQSNGGLLPATAAADQPAQMLNSGPAAGVIGAVAMAAELGEKNLITLDTGGTSTDVCLVTDGTAEVTSARRVDGLPLHVESTDIVSVGAGGGSIAWRDAGGLLRVGPHSAGASPGPACYGRGGHDPTVTDAMVILGWLRPQQFLGGGMALDLDAAHHAVAELAASVGMTTEQTAESIVRIAVANMNDALRLVSVSRGHDPRDYTLFIYGGSGGLHAAFVAEEMNIDRIIIPPNAGLFSAYGLLVADLQRDYQETRFSLLSETTPADMRSAFEGLAARAHEDFASHGTAAEKVEFSWSVDLRYLGQGYELTVGVDPTTVVADSLRDAFAITHEARYGSRGLGGELEIVTYRLSATSRRSKHMVAAGPGASMEVAEAGPMFVDGGWVNGTFVSNDAFAPGATLNGPAIIEDTTSTTIVPPGWKASVHETGSVVMEVCAR